MASSYEKYQKRKLISSYFSVIFSIFLVLFLLGSLSLFVIHSQKISDNFRENIPMTVFFEKNANEKQLKDFDKKLSTLPYIKDYKFVSKQDAALQHQEDLGENFLEFLGFNPLQDSFDIHLLGNYVETDSISKIEQEFYKSKAVKEVTYDKELVTLVNQNIKTITKWVLIATAVLTLVSMLLINSSLRLLIYSSRFTIKTMQMVGATKKFIRRPFIFHSVKLGLIGALLAIISLVGISFYINNKFPDLNLNPRQDYIPLVVVSLGLLLVGIIITTISTFFATQRFLNLKSDQLY
ncbi:cell division protein FtsX [Myroides sp. LJL119]